MATCCTRTNFRVSQQRGVNTYAIVPCTFSICLTWHDESSNPLKFQHDVNVVIAYSWMYGARLTLCFTSCHVTCDHVLSHSGPSLPYSCLHYAAFTATTFCMRYFDEIFSLVPNDIVFYLICKSDYKNCVVNLFSLFYVHLVLKACFISANILMKKQTP